MNNGPLEEAWYGTYRIEVIVDGDVHRRATDPGIDSISSPFTGFIGLALFGPDDTICNAYRLGTGGAYEGCPVSDAPNITIDYFQARDDLPDLSGLFTTDTPIRPREQESYTNLSFVSGDLTLVVDIEFVNTPYK